MSADLVSKEDLLAAGWKISQVAAALDEADEVGPSGHWLNRYGKPFFYKDRVEVAAFRVGLSTVPPSTDAWNKWACSEKPSSKPVMTLHFHRIANELIEGAWSRFKDLRLPHPVLGRIIGTREKEILLVEEVLLQLANTVSGMALQSRAELDRFLVERSLMAIDSLGPQWEKGVVVRPARMRSYVSKACGHRSVQRCLDAFSLVHAGHVLTPDGQIADLINLLISSPRLRFDTKELCHG